MPQKLIPELFLILVNNLKQPLHVRNSFTNQISWKRMIKKFLKKLTLFASWTACHPYVTRMSSVCHSYILLCHSYVLVCHSYVTRMYSYVIRMYSYVIRMSLVCTRMSPVCHSHVLVFHPYVTRMYSYVIRMSLVCGFPMNRWLLLSEQILH